MSFKHKLLQIYAKYDLSPTSLSRRLGYSSAEKISRLTRSEDNLPSIQIIRDILKAFPDIDAKWLVTDEHDKRELIEEPRAKYGFCRECIKKEGKIEQLEKQCAAKDKRIEELLIKIAGAERGAASQETSEKKAS